MLIHADLTQRAVVHTDTMEWLASPSPGIERRMLDRDGGEVARATSIVRYAAGAVFPYHVHGGGEEFLVLEGLFLDEHGRYPAGTYVRNPVGTSHWPAAGPQGATLLVKLRQMDPADTAQVRIDTRAAQFSAGPVPGLTVLPLHAFGSERVSLVRWAPNIRFMLHAHPGGEEIFVLDGAVEDDEGRYMAGSWLRNPPGSHHEPFSLDGCLLYVKIGHLPAVTA